MNSPDSGIDKNIKNLKVIHIALIIGQLAFLGVVIGLDSANGFHQDFDFSHDPFLIVAPLLTVFGLFLSNFMFKKFMAQINENDLPQTKMAKYQTASIIRYALLEAPSLFGIVALMQSSNIIFIIFPGILIIYFVIIRPKSENILRELNVNKTYNAGYKQ